MKKRSYRVNIYGNVVGYEGGKRAVEFGAFMFPGCYTERQAKAWAERKEDWKEA